MANTLTNLIPAIYESLDVVSRELTGFIPAVTLDAGIERAAVGQTVYVPIAPASTASDITPGVTAPNDGDQVIGSTSLTISKARAVPIRWNGEEVRGLGHGPGRARIQLDQISQAIRTLVNEIEVDCAGLYTRSSRAWGTAGTTPFASDLSDVANMLQILVDNGCPQSDLQLVINTSAGTKMRTLGQLTKANEAGDTSLLRQGVLGDLHGFAIRESAAVKLHTIGTNNGTAAVNNAGYAVGATSLVLASAGTGTIVAGDVVTFAGDTNKYVIDTGDADVSGGGTIAVNGPGLRVAMSAANKVITTGAAYRANMAFHRSAMILATRAPALPEEGDMAHDRTLITDPRTGLTFELAMYKQYRQVRYELSIAWGQGNIKSAHTATLLG